MPGSPWVMPALCSYLRSVMGRVRRAGHTGALSQAASLESQVRDDPGGGGGGAWGVGRAAPLHGCSSVEQVIVSRSSNVLPDVSSERSLLGMPLVSPTHPVSQGERKSSSSREAPTTDDDEIFPSPSLLPFYITGLNVTLPPRHGEPYPRLTVTPPSVTLNPYRAHGDTV